MVKENHEGKAVKGIRAGTTPDPMVRGRDTEQAGFTGRQPRSRSMTATGRSTKRALADPDSVFYH